MRSHLTVRRSRPPSAAAELRALVPSPALCAQPPVPALRPVPKAYLPFGPPALVQQAPPAILLAALRRFRGPALLRGLRPYLRQGAPFWPSGLTLRSSGPAFCGPLTLAVRLHDSQIISKGYELYASCSYYLGTSLRFSIRWRARERQSHSSRGLPRIYVLSPNNV